MQTILIVDDDEFICLFLQSILEASYRVLTARDGEAALGVVQREAPDLVLLDVEMPGMNGFETCRRLKSGEGADTPVIFVSALNRVEDKLSGYGAGADDYLPKPIMPSELLAKVQANLKSAQARKQLRHVADEAGSTAMTAMTTLGELGIILQTTQHFTACDDLDSLADTAMEACSSYGLSAIVRLLTPRGKALRATEGSVTEIAVAAIRQVSRMGRIVEFGSHFAINYKYVSLIIRNMPREEERRGRLRDHLATLAEIINSRAEAIDRSCIIEHAADEISVTLGVIDSEQRKRRFLTSAALEEIVYELERAYVSLSLTDAQELFMAGIVQTQMERIRIALSDETDIQSRLSKLIVELRPPGDTMPGAAGGAVRQGHDANPETGDWGHPLAPPVGIPSGTVTLFD